MKARSVKTSYERRGDNIKEFTIGTAVMLLRKKERVARKGWNGKEMYLEIQYPDINSEMSLPYIYMKTACGNTVPWLASQSDILAEDWVLVKTEPKLPTL